MAPATNRDLAADIRTNGFAVIRNFFEASEIERLRALASAHLEARGVPLLMGRVQPNAAMEMSGLDWLYTSDKVITLYRQALETDGIVFTGHCDIHRDIRSGWHKDSGKEPGDYLNGDYFGAADCKIYKLGIYLQDHVGDASGLSVRPRSQHLRDVDAGEPAQALDTRAGDVILFDVRLSHRGQSDDPVETALKLAGLIGRAIGFEGNAAQSRLHNWYLRLKQARPRYSIFFTFGYPNQFTEDFAQGNMKRQLRQTHGALTTLPPVLGEELRRRGVRLASVLQGHGGGS